MSDDLKTKISVLAQLAAIDGEFDVRELAFIYNVCLRNNVDVDSVGDIITSPDPLISPEDLGPDDHSQYLADVITLMMIDGKILPLEVGFCLDIGRRLGFDVAALEMFVEELRGQWNISPSYIKERVDTLPKIARL